MRKLETIIDEEKLEAWCKRLPQCRTFLENFFMTCGPYAREENYINYRFDIEEYIEVHPSWARYADNLIEAFNDISK
ncbi:hypothetical protein HY772_09225, partial [Candidatus Woesearchaeota archaeon]|nr:hypothetical protein [Candidatus Woesearchaeota archaeon]